MTPVAAIFLMLGTSAQTANVSAPIAPASAIAKFRSICLEHVGDIEAQKAAAASSPWGIALSPSINDGGLHHRTGTELLSIYPNRRACSLTVVVPQTETLASVEAALSSIVPIQNWKPLPEADSKYVLIALDGSNEQFAILLKVSDKTKRNLATFSVEKRQITK